VKAWFRRTAIAALLTSSAAVPARGQLLPPTPDVTGSRVRIGPLWLNPSVALSNIGVDTNLFNDADAEDPKRDLAVALVPQTALWMRAGRTWFTGNVRQDMIWFRNYRDQGSSNGSYRAGWMAPLTRVALTVDGHFVRARQRPGFEIDSRALRREGALTAALEIRALPRTYLGGTMEGRDVRFSSGSFFEGQDLRQELNRRRTAGALTFRYALTPMTSLVVEASGYGDRFTFSPGRDADSVQIGAGFKFDPAARTQGSIVLGWRKFTPASRDIPEFAGLTVAAAVTYVAWGSTRLTLEGVRDVEYSFEPRQPYYVIGGGAATLTQRVAGPLDVQGRAGSRTLAYRDRLSAVPVPGNRRDTVTTLGGGIGYRAARELRIAFDLEQQRRTSPLTYRRYAGFRYGISFTYGA
jgi:Putative beta-barrel porin 2